MCAEFGTLSKMARQVSNAAKSGADAPHTELVTTSIKKPRPVDTLSPWLAWHTHVRHRSGAVCRPRLVPHASPASEAAAQHRPRSGATLAAKKNKRVVGGAASGRRPPLASAKAGS